ncbi:hypothetical protein [Kluyvera sichuanensis]|uniref:hypothetical protein n=1 Tax=Kluyvera sichuanensis TaxID=2725494 RepID=UPI0034A354E7
MKKTTEGLTVNQLAECNAELVTANEKLKQQLADAQAEGAELAGEYLKQYAQGLHEDARLVLQDAGELCNGFAAQLRQGAEHD